MNDFRSYSAAFMDHQNDLMHYGTKGMKWHHHKRQPIVGPDLRRGSHNPAAWNRSDKDSAGIAKSYAEWDKIARDARDSVKGKSDSDVSRAILDNLMIQSRTNGHLPDPKTDWNKYADATSKQTMTLEGLKREKQYRDRKAKKEAAEKEEKEKRRKALERSRANRRY